MLDSTDYSLPHRGNTSTNTASSNTVLYSTTTAKQTARAVRVWLENKSKLEHAGFHAGARYGIAYREGYAVLTLDQNGTGTVSSCKRGDVERPIIDLHSKAVAGAFNPGEPLTIHYHPGRIEISVDMLALAIGE